MFHVAYVGIYMREGIYLSMVNVQNVNVKKDVKHLYIV